MSSTQPSPLCPPFGQAAGLTEQLKFRRVGKGREETSKALEDDIEQLPLSLPLDPLGDRGRSRNTTGVLTHLGWTDHMVRGTPTQCVDILDSEALHATRFRQASRSRHFGPVQQHGSKGT